MASNGNFLVNVMEVMDNRKKKFVIAALISRRFLMQTTMMFAIFFCE